MKNLFPHIIRRIARERGYRRFCEIGASFGENTKNLLTLNPAHVTVIDPCIDADLAQRFASHPTVRVVRGLSLEVLPSLHDKFDCFLIDGDHNWYTVFNELKYIEDRGLLEAGGAIFLHDIAWPYGRRDMYYQPEVIPREFIQPHAQKGIIRGRSELSEANGANSTLHNAEFEGGRRNGVLAAVEEFLEHHGHGYSYIKTEQDTGLGILLKGSRSKDVFFARKWQLRLRLQDVGGRRGVLVPAGIVLSSLLLTAGISHLVRRGRR